MIFENKNNLSDLSSAFLRMSEIIKQETSKIIAIEELVKNRYLIELKLILFKKSDVSYSEHATAPIPLLVDGTISMKSQEKNIE